MASDWPTWCRAVWCRRWIHAPATPRAVGDDAGYGQNSIIFPTDAEACRPFLRVAGGPPESATILRIRNTLALDTSWCRRLVSRAGRQSRCRAAGSPMDWPSTGRQLRSVGRSPCGCPRLMTSRPSDTDFAMPRSGWMAGRRRDGRERWHRPWHRAGVGSRGADVALVPHGERSRSRVADGGGHRSALLMRARGHDRRDASVQVVEHARDHFGRLDIVVHAAGITYGSRPWRSHARSSRR